MMDSSNRNRLRAGSIGAALVAAAALAGCGGALVGADESTHPSTVLMVDVSGSTKRLAATEFPEAIRSAITGTALARGTLWATAADSAALANSNGWTIDAVEFKTDSVGPDLQRDDLTVKARQLADSGKAAALLERSGRKGSDLLGMLRLAGSVLAGRTDGSKRNLVMLTDGGINQASVDLLADPPANAVGRKALISRFASAGLISRNSLTEGRGKPVDVWLCGIGVGATGNEGANAWRLVDFWKDLIAYSGGRVVSSQASCSSLQGLG